MPYLKIKEFTRKVDLIYQDLNLNRDSSDPILSYINSFFERFHKESINSNSPKIDDKN